MTNNNNHKIQGLGLVLLMPVLVFGLLSGCVDQDQTEKDINSPSAGMLHLGNQMREAGDDQGAMEFYARAIQRNPDDIEAHEKLAALLETHGDQKDAIDQYKALVTLVPDNANYHRAYGRLLIMLDQPADAKEQYQAALAIDTSDTRALNGLGISFDLLGDHASAQEQYKTALQEKPDDLVTLNNLGHSYILGASYDAAISLLEPQYNNPAAPAAMRENLAEAYGMSGMYFDAERVLKKDFTADQIKKKLAQFRTQRTKKSIPAVYANLGSFSTSDLANARLGKLKEQFAADLTALNLGVVPEVDAEGGTPVFIVRVSGFKDLAAAHTFCIKLKKGDAFCKEHEG